MNAVTDKGLEIIHPKVNQSFSFGSGEIYIWAPDEVSEQSNNNSLIVKLAIAENSRVAIDQTEYEKRYTDLTVRYEAAKVKYDTAAAGIEQKNAKRELFKGFIRALEKQEALIDEFEPGLWCSLVQEVVIKAKDDITFIFKNGFETKVS